MLRIPGQPGRDLCDTHLGITRRDLVRIGGSAILGMTLGPLLNLRAKASPEAATKGGPGWGKAKSVVNLTWAKILSGKYVVNVHESAAALGRYVSCGNIPK